MGSESVVAAQQSLLISILNWNTAQTTLACIDSLLDLDALPNVKVEILVIDNGSSDSDCIHLQQGVNSTKVTLHREMKNLGFAGGHNIAIGKAIKEKFDFIWLVNSDAIVEQKSALAKLIATMNADPECGAVSPLIVSLDDGQKIDFCGAYHDWGKRQTIRPKQIAESQKLQEAMPKNMWVTGTAVLFRVSALEQIGGLDERFFAYYEDDDIGARLTAGGWLCRVAFDSRVKHVVFAREVDRPPYYFYLLHRNYLMFWYKNTPPEYRRLLLLKLLDFAFYEVNRLYNRGFKKQADASMLGIYDFMRGRYGPPRLDQAVPLSIRVARALFSITQYKALKKSSSSQALTSDRIAG